jgi:glycine/D-amino acid oxidase-like deaminating enzyme/nitrite reductase/ring-hydroxylating ferredoxin subunit
MNPSIWQAEAQQPDLPVLLGDMTVDTVVVGGGITGLTAAMKLSKAGQRVVVLESGRIGGGTTGHSTGNLYAMVGTPLSQLRIKWGEGVMCAVVRSRASAVDFVETTVREQGIDCAFARRSWHLYTPAGAARQGPLLEHERIAAMQAGLAARLVARASPAFDTGQTLVVDGQAQFNPLSYVRGLASAIASERCAIFRNSEVTEIDKENCAVHTAGGRVSAANIVMATHVPKGPELATLQVAPYREYALAATLRSGDYPQGIFWSAGEKRYSIRSHESEGRQYLIAIGEKHKTGQARDTAMCYAKLESWARSHFDIEKIDRRWSAQGYYPVDDLPYIGQSVGSKNVYIATGFAADGLTWGTLAGLTIAAQILGTPDELAAPYRPTRIDPARSAKKFVVESANVAKEYVAGYLGSAPEAHGLEELAVGEGRVVKVNGERVAVSRDKANSLRAVSAVCTHLGCIVGWNGAEQTWDCPCHGSRFSPGGALIEGPALGALKELSLPRANVAEPSEGSTDPTPGS